MAFLMKFVQSSFRRINTPEDSPSSASSSSPTTRRTGGAPFTIEVPCNPEIGVGLLAAVAAPASSYLRVANKPVLTGIRGIMAVTADLCCNGACETIYCCGTVEAITSRVYKFCRLCSHRLDGRRVYIYKFNYFMEALYNKRHRELIGMPPERIRADIKAWLVSEEEKKSFMEIF